MGLRLATNTSTANDQGFAYIGLHRKSYISATGTGNDMNDHVGIWIKGFYQGVGSAMPVFIGGAGYNSEDSKLMVDRNGNIGIGTVSPGTEYNKNQTAYPVTYGPTDRVLTIRSSNLPVLELSRPAGSTVGDRVGAIYFTNGTNQADAHLQVAGIWAENDGRTEYPNLMAGRLVFMTKRYGGATQGKMVLDQNGNLGIGTLDTKGYKLAVAGNMIAEKVKVKLQSGWPDYVFEEDYPLPPLAEVAAYVKANRHLPEMPTAGQIAEEGLDVGEMNKRLLQKVEELTLYIIEQQQQIAEQRHVNKIQMELLRELQREVKELKK
ncbi:hypothetical protein [Chitinophaga japonensis]|uniref:hypothetical protein n=1 Tax=Chitinophaga japonensis TaxID=104662 RepID=UPI0011A76E26|nr:hypothetical protein [Chitinophaga japonensis]